MRVRFAPSPTGNIHIGNIRTAIFNWLAARSCGGEFLLRIEDTDRERSTDEAVQALFGVMEWMGLTFDGEPVYQSAQREAHLTAAESLLEGGHAYRFAKGDGGEATLLRFPWNTAGLPFVVDTESVELELHADEPVCVDQTGVSYSLRTRKGKPAPQQGTLAGFKGLQLYNAAGTLLLGLDDEVGGILDGTVAHEVAGAVRMVFQRREVQFTDLVKGHLSKPLDSMRDQVIVRSDGNPVFHLANVCDDIAMEISHVIRGDDHVENTFRHVFLYASLGAKLPQFAHLPMIVNQQGRPYSKRDGDAYVGDFRAKGYQPDALFNYLTLLGWSPGHDVEYMPRPELIAAFALDRVISSPAQMDFRKLLDFNGRYLADLPFAEFANAAWAAAADEDWAGGEREFFDQVALLLQTRTKLFTDVAGWAPFFVETLTYDEKAVRKHLAKDGVADRLRALAAAFSGLEAFDVAGIESAIHGVTEAAEMKQGKLNQPIRVALTGQSVGAGIYETAALLGRERVLARLEAGIAQAG